MRSVLLFLLFAIVATAETRYYLIEGAMELADGRGAGTSISIVKRTVDREAGKIEEAVIQLRGQEPAQEHIMVIKPGQPKSQMIMPGFTGEATLGGPEWAWTSMTYTAKMEKGGMEIQGEDQFSPESITAVKKIIKSGGGVQVIIRESGRSITEATYQLLRSRVLPK